MDNKQTEQAQQIKLMLDQWQEHTLLIMKQEKNDTDKIKLTLSGVQVEERTQPADDYLPSCSLKLIGRGTIQNDSGEDEPLPYESYDIALEERIQIHVDEAQLRIITERASYIIECR